MEYCPALYGNGDQTTPIIVLKPQLAGLDTNLLITTDRRAYYLRLISKPQDYVARVAFQYPADQSPHKWQEQLAEQRQRERETKSRSDAVPAMIAVEKMNFDYKVRGGNEHLRPVRVFDDGAKTCIQMPNEMQNREAPVLLILGNDGKGEMSNYRVRQQLKRWRLLVAHSEDKETQAARPPLESPAGLDLHPKPESSPRISKRVGIIIGVAGLLILIGFAYGGYRRSVKAQATARAHGAPRTLAPAGDAEIVKGIPAGNAAVAHKPAAQPADLDSPEESGAAIPNPCVSEGRSGRPFRFNPETGQPCSAPVERVVVRRSHVQPPTVVAPPPAREPSRRKRRH